MVALPPFPRLLPVVPSEPHWEGTPAGEPGGGDSQRGGVVPGPGEVAVIRALLGGPSYPLHH